MHVAHAATSARASMAKEENFWRETSAHGQQEPATPRSAVQTTHTNMSAPNLEMDEVR